MCDYEQPEFFHETSQKARKIHNCAECDRGIHPGEHYTRFSGKWDGDVQTFKTCSDCIEIREMWSKVIHKLYEEDGCSPAFGNLWCDLRGSISMRTQEYKRDPLVQPTRQAWAKMLRKYRQMNIDTKYIVPPKLVRRREQKKALARRAEWLEQQRQKSQGDIHGSSPT